jgi:putative SOS response-associated peptidase YedK
MVTEANALKKPIHDRMPMILSTETYAVWMDPANSEPEGLKSSLRSYPPEHIVLHAINKYSGEYPTD